ncbi:MAG: zinc ribbon domain-containing protein [Oscillospiraceae bacterium]|nr:zinc ribbon domain-containing protein [Oscillospiraceae bacterium]
MKLPEQAAYLKGLLDGLDIDREKPEGKLLAAIVDVLNETAETVADIEDVVDTISDELDEIEDAIDEIEDCLIEDEDEDDYDFDDDDDEFDFGDETIYEVKCPTCGEVIDLDEEMLEAGATKCPNCGEDLEFDDEEPEM